MATQSLAQRVIALRERYEQLAITLRGNHLFSSDQAERHNIGRFQALEYLAADLSSIQAPMRPAQVREIILRGLCRLDEAKVTWLVNSIHKRKLNGSNRLGEWTAEGAIAQIDEMVPELYAVMVSHLTAVPRIQSRFFQVFQRLDPDVADDLPRIATRWAWARQYWFREVAVVEFGDENMTPDQCHEGIGLIGRRGGPKALWSLDGADLEQTGQGDVIVALLSGEAWILTDARPRPVDAFLPESASSQASTYGPVAQFARRYGLALRIDAGPLPAALICSDPFFEPLRERYLGKMPPHDLWKLALYYLDERGEARTGSPALPLTWECDRRPTCDEVLLILQDMIDTVWDAVLLRCSREVWDEYGCDLAAPGEENRAFEAQSWNVDRLRGFLGEEAFDALRAIEGEAS